MTEQIVLLEHLKGLIGGRSVIAALFYTFNFDTTFFEHHICPLFVPEVEFSDNVIQNAILWKMYSDRLPPIVVYCDEHMKGNAGPTLGYDLTPVSLAPIGESSSCFHAKHSFLALSDNSLLVLTGSNNLTMSGWCRNIECLDIRVLQAQGPNKYYPKALLEGIRSYMTHADSLWMTKEQRDHLAIAKVRSLVDRQSKVDGGPRFFTSHKDTFWSVVKEIKKELDLEGGISKVEVISPYMSSGISHFEQFAMEVDCPDIRLSIPFEAEGVVGVPEELFSKVVDHPSYRWYQYLPDKTSKGFRFCHAKIYQFWGDQTVVRVIGSVNFTDAAFRGLKGQSPPGNLESAICYHIEVAEAEELLVTASSDDSLTFATSRHEQEEKSARLVPFKLDFVVDWRDNTLHIVNHDPEKQKGKVIFTDTSIPAVLINKAKKCHNLTTEQLADILSSQMITVKTTDNSGRHFTYFPKHLNLSARPLPARYNISDTDLFELWRELESKVNGPEKSRIIASFIKRVTDQYGDDNDDELTLTRSILNQMAGHLNGLLALKAALLDDIDSLTKKGRLVKATKVTYYLTADNVDTLTNYMRLLAKLHKEGAINLGFYWLMLTLLDDYFYNNDRICDLVLTDATALLSDLQSRLRKTLRKVHGSMIDAGVSTAQLKWLKKQVHA